MNKTKISWTDATWNPVSGCTHVSDGCRQCYAEALSLRFGWSKHPWTAQHEAENVVLHPDRLDQPRRLRKPSRIFTCSMSDLFHPRVPDEFIDQVFAVMADCRQHSFQVLTKRPERAARWSAPWPSNVWIGTSVEDARVTERIDILRQVPAQVRFVSFEPLLGPVGPLDLTGVDWCIAGGESGNGFRAMDHAWARQIRDACVATKVAFFFKQSSAPRTEVGTALFEEDGSAWQWHQYPGLMFPPICVSAVKILTHVQEK